MKVQDERVISFFYGSKTQALCVEHVGYDWGVGTEECEEGLVMFVSMPRDTL